MEESRELKQLFAFLQGAVYTSVILEVLMYVHFTNLPAPIILILDKLSAVSIYQKVFLSKATTLLLIAVVSIGSRPKKVSRIEGCSTDRTTASYWDLG
jgi:hypothetical protein